MVNGGIVVVVASVVLVVELVVELVVAREDRARLDSFLRRASDGQDGDDEQNS